MTERLGLHAVIEDLYWRVQFARHSGVESHEIAGTTAHFTVTNPTECKRVSELMGEMPIIEDMLTELVADDVVYDVGANIGTYTCFLAQRLPPEQVVAFEPHPSNSGALRRNLEYNGLEATVREQALAAKTGTTDLAVASEASGEGAHALATGEESKTITVPVETGDRLIEDRAPVPTILKIDVEGAEQQVLEGFTDTLSRPSCRCCYVELHPDRLRSFGDSVAAVEATLESYGFELKALKNRERESFVKAAKRQ
ncbi:FkbM family methyltransferase [Haloarcula halophila]|uniref:FkbM family methyltransferase n=2 Tax=Haloarcula TaxID=2237 RepID=UPI003610BC68